MVGVAGRSRGCVTCRLRRVKCDEGHPTCNRCAKADRVCGGYLQNNFVDGLPRAVKMKATSSKLPSTRERSLIVRSTPAPAKATAPRIPERTSSAKKSATSINALLSARSFISTYIPLDQNDGEKDIKTEYPLDGEERALQPQLQAVQVAAQAPPSLNLTSFQDDIMLTYAIEYMLKGFDSERTGDYITWEDLNIDKLSRDSLLTSATVYFGHRNQQKEIIELGMQRYSTILKDMNAALSDPIMSRSTSVMYAVLTLLLCEWAHPSGLFGWVQHALGLERLFAHRGPEAHRSGKDLIVFQNLRMTVVFACMTSKKECLLATPEWCTIPWSLDPASKPLDHYLLDILGQYGPWMKDMDAYWISESPTEELAAKVFEATVGFKGALAQLDAWWEMFQVDPYAKYWECPMDTTGVDPECIPKRWTTIYRFTHTLRAKDFINYHAGRAMALGIARGADALDLDADPAELARMATETRDAAVEACRAFEFLLEPERDGAGALYLLYPMRVAWWTIGGDTAEGRWLKHISDLVARGFRGGWSGMGEITFADFEIHNGLDDVRDG